MNITYPLISCICITRNRPLLLYKAIDCFVNQSYPNKELIVLYESDDILTPEILKKCKYLAGIIIYCVERSIHKKLGFLRNLAIKKASGQYICQWDDDDWFHSDRLMIQYQYLQLNSQPCCVLTEWTIFNEKTRQAYKSLRRNWEGSLLAESSQFDVFQYYNLRRGEDTPLIQAISNQNLLAEINEKPWLYIYRHHTKNTFGNRHFNNLYKGSLPLSSLSNDILQYILSDECSTQNGSELIYDIYNS